MFAKLPSSRNKNENTRQGSEVRTQAEGAFSLFILAMHDGYRVSSMSRMYAREYKPIGKNRPRTMHFVGVFSADLF